MSMNEMNQRKLGKGAFGAVFKLTSNLDNKTYALKNIETDEQEIKDRAILEFFYMHELSYCPFVICASDIYFW